MTSDGSAETPREADESPQNEPSSRHGDRSLFQHPRWMVGVVLVLAVAAIVAGFKHPAWWLAGSPFIATLALYLWVRMVGRD